MRPRQQRRRRLRRRADAGAARRRRLGVPASAAWPTCAATRASTSRSSAGSGITVVEVADSQAWELHFSEVSDCTLIVDAIFGTGLNAPVTGLIESVVADVNASGIPVVAIDLPSGLSADSPEPIGPSIEAGLTVTLAAPKLPLVLPPGETRAGDIVIADIGIPGEVLEAVDGPRVDLLTRAVDARADHAADGRTATRATTAAC